MIKRLLWSLRLDKYSVRDWIAAKFPFHIPTKKPVCQNELCSCCNEVMNKLCAYDTGDGWMFFWECKNNCGETDEAGIEDWYPFLFGAWSSEKDLERAGIEVV
jgi:hypothetical protein